MDDDSCHVLTEANMRQHATPPKEPLWTTDGIAGYLNASRRTVERMRAAGKLPRPDCRVGTMPRWKPETIWQWMDDQKTRRN